MSIASCTYFVTYAATTYLEQWFIALRKTEKKTKFHLNIMTTTRKDALKAAAVVGLASLVSGEANIRDGADNFGKERSLQYQYEESWYDIPDPMHNQPVHYEQQPIYYGGEIMTEAKAGKEKHGNDGGSSGGYDGKTGKTDHEVEPLPQDSGSSKTSKTHVESSSKTSKTHVEEEAPIWSGWHPASGKVDKMHPEEEGPMLIPKSDKMHPEEESPMLIPKAEKMHPEEERPRWSGWHPSGKVEKEPVTELVYPAEASGWWSADSGKTDKSKSAKAKSAKTSAEHTSSEDDDWWGSSEDWWGSMQTTVTAATMPIETTNIATMPAAKGAKEDEDTIGTTSTWWAVPDGSKTQKSGKSSKSGKSGKTGKTGKTEESWSWDSTWTTPSPCGKAEDCDHLIPTIEVEEHTPSEEHIDEEDDSPPPTMSPVTPLVPVTMAPVVGQNRAVPTTSSPTTIIHALTSEAGWFQSGKEYETEELAYKRERVEGLAKQMEWKNSSSRPQVYPYLAVGAAAGLFFMLC